MSLYPFNKIVACVDPFLDGIWPLLQCVCRIHETNCDSGGGSRCLVSVVAIPVGVFLCLFRTSGKREDGEIGGQASIPAALAARPPSFILFC